MAAAAPWPGRRAEEAFFVRCDETKNPPDARANGRLLAEVGVAPSIPFEFVVLRVGRQGNEFEIQELHRWEGADGARRRRGSASTRC